MSDDFEFGIGEWETRNGRKAVILHRLIHLTSEDTLLGYVEFDSGQQYTSVWTLGGKRLNGGSSALWSLKRPQPKPREWWINLYPTRQWAHTTREKADDKAIPNLLIACVHVREVLEDDGTDS